MTTQPLAEPATVSDLEIGIKGEGKGANKSLLWGVMIMFIGAAIGVLGKKLMHETLLLSLGC